VLLIDDEAPVLRLLTRWLQPDMDVVAVASGEAACELVARDDAFDVIFCDLMMPGMSGMDAHRWLAEHDEDLARKVVFVTGGAFTEGAEAYLAGLPNPCVYKPLDRGTFTALALRRVRAERAG
jgi:CheY-like chemotaxis protein